jgi:Winged helix-turn helix
MTRATVLQEVRPMRFEELSARRQRRDLTLVEAAELLGVTERTFRRWSTRYEAEGSEELEERRLGRASARARSTNCFVRPFSNPCSPRIFSRDSQSYNKSSNNASFLCLAWSSNPPPSYRRGMITSDTVNLTRPR